MLVMNRIALGLLLAAATVSTVYAEEYQGEIMSVQGQVTVTDASGVSREAKEGDLFGASSKVEVGPSGHADLALDKDWKNVVRVESGSEVNVRSIYPTGFSLTRGALFARLGALPEKSTFEVETPTAVASVRGTEYRTTFDPSSGTEVFSFSNSPVYVFGLDESGKLTGEPLTLRNEEKTGVLRRGEAPKKPFRMAENERKFGADARRSIEGRIKDFRKAGRLGKAQDIARVRKDIQAKLRASSGSKGQNFGPRKRDERGAVVRRAERAASMRENAQEGRRNEGIKKGKRRKRPLPFDPNKP